MCQDKLAHWKTALVLIIRWYIYIHSLINCTNHQHRIREASRVHDYIKERTIKIGRYIVGTRKTVRTIAKEFGVSKSTVHKDLTERLPEINAELANEVKDILEYHKSIRHLRGGEATKVKYRKTVDVSDHLIVKSRQ